MNDVRARLISCFEVVFPDVPKSEIPGASVANTKEWDSINALNLVRVIEETFGVELDFEELEALTSFQAIEAHLSGLVKPGGSS